MIMIRLKQLLREITMGKMAPYATQFAWQSAGSGYNTLVPCDGISVKFSLSWNWSAEGNEYAFAIATPSSQPGSGYTMSHDSNTTGGQLSYLRVLATAAEAIFDFCAQHSPQAIDVTGFDPSRTKDLQKTRIYRGLLHTNKNRIQQAGYRILDRNGKLWLVRASNADATGTK